MEKRIFVVTSKEDLKRCYPVMKELRPHLSFDDYISIYEQAHASDGFEIVAIESDEGILAVMGYRFCRTMCAANMCTWMIWSRPNVQGPRGWGRNF